jgi:hypothetical protein
VFSATGGGTDPGALIQGVGIGAWNGFIWLSNTFMAMSEHTYGVGPLGPIRTPYVQTVGFQQNGEALFGVLTVLGDFSIFDWTGYPEGPKPTGPFRVAEGPEYRAALKAKNAANNAAHRANLSLKGLEIHEINPVKFGGSPTDVANKVALPKEIHVDFTKWWAQLLRDLSK